MIAHFLNVLFYYTDAVMKLDIRHHSEEVDHLKPDYSQTRDVFARLGHLHTRAEERGHTDNSTEDQLNLSSSIMELALVGL